MGKDKLIQNPPNSQDLAYSIESIWAYIKPRIKQRDPKNIEELKQFTIEEWNSIPWIESKIERKTIWEE